MADYLEHSKIVLSNVSEDPELFEKELKKSLGWIKPEQVSVLAAWCFLTFSHCYNDILNEVFTNLS